MMEAWTVDVEGCRRLVRDEERPAVGEAHRQIITRWRISARMLYLAQHRCGAPGDADARAIIARRGHGCSFAREASMRGHRLFDLEPT